MLAYPVEFCANDGTLMAVCPDLPEFAAIGDTEDQALAQAADVLGFLMAMRIKDRREIPDPSPADGRATVALSLQGELKVMIYRALREDGITPTQLARRLGKSESAARRLLDLDHASPIGQIEEALAALGRHVDVRIARDAA